MDWPVPVMILVGAAAWFGHSFLLTVVLNWVYAQAWPRPILKSIRTGIAILVIVFPLIFGFFVSRPLTIESTAFRIFIFICLATTVIYLPFISIFAH